MQWGRALRDLWHLEPQIHFLNHGSFGATPRAILAAQQQWQLRMESEPVRFMTDELPAALRAAAARLAGFLGTRGERLAFCSNATTGVNAVLAAQPWRSGDEIVVADHAYAAVRNAVTHIARRHELLIRPARIPFPLAGDDDIVAAYAKAMTPRTRLLIVDHVFSPLAVVAPVERLVALAHDAGVPVLVDGAHAPGMLPLALDTLGADWYVGNLHKWLFAPKGCAFLHAAEGADADLHPPVISNDYGAGFPREFDWVGTQDYSPWLCVDACLDFIDRLGPAAYRDGLRQQAQRAGEQLSRAWRVPLPAPPAMFAAMVTLPLPVDATADLGTARALRRRLLDAHRIEVPVLVIGARLWVRISAQVYNEDADHEALAAAVASWAGSGGRAPARSPSP